MRLFVALPILPDVQVELASIVERFRAGNLAIRWLDSANWHVTLKFIGHVPAETLPDIEKALASVAVPQRFNIQFGGIGFFPSDKRPSVIWADIEAPPALAELARKIDENLAECGVLRETRAFSPHLTLARLKHDRISAPLRAALDTCKTHSFGSQLVTKFNLIESKTKPAGAEYTTLRSYPFAAEAATR